MRVAAFIPRAGAALLMACAFGCASDEAGRQFARERVGTATLLCPMAMPGVRVLSFETFEGAAVHFVLGDETRVAELRDSVRAMLARHEAQARRRPSGQAQAEAAAHQCPVCPGLPPRMAPPRGLGPGIGTGGAGIESVHVPAARLSVEDTEDGADLVYVPEDPADAESLREAVRRLVVQVHAGECPLLGGAQR